MTREQYEQLKTTIDEHMDRYYNQDAPTISDFEYDRLMQELKNAEKENPEWITPYSPSQKIGGTAKREAGVKVAHRVPMLSIEDVFTKEDVTAWVDKVLKIHPDAAFSVETKIDGLSVTLRYKGEAGKLQLTLGETRGDGHTGEDVTANIRMIPDVPQEAFHGRADLFFHAPYEPGVPGDGISVLHEQGGFDKLGVQLGDRG